MKNLRAAAAVALAEVLQGGRTLDDAVQKWEAQVEERDRAMLRQLCFGSCRWFHQLDGLIRPLLKKPFKSRDTDLYGLLLGGAYQLLHMRVPDHAAINESVAATRAMDKSWASGLVNGVLRNLARNQSALLDALPPHALSAHPKWLYQRVEQAWPEQAAAILASNNQQPPMTLRVNLQKLARDEWLQKASAQGVAASACEISDSGVTLTHPASIERVPGFRDGEVSVQDESAQLCALLLACAPGDQVLDACAAPGGKTGHLLERFPGIRLTAMDAQASRLQRITENLDRLQLPAKVICGDASDPAGDWRGSLFDYIIVDAPCSGSGVIRRHPDIKILRKPEQITSLCTQQAAILDGLWSCLRPGGQLLYITCSILPEENEHIVAAFIARTLDVRALPLVVDWGLATPHGRQILPQPDRGDGFFYALLEKTH